MDSNEKINRPLACCSSHIFSVFSMAGENFLPQQQCHKGWKLLPIPPTQQSRCVAIPQILAPLILTKSPLRFQVLGRGSSANSDYNNATTFKAVLFDRPYPFTQFRKASSASTRPCASWTCECNPASINRSPYNAFTVSNNTQIASLR
ncbi:hypothetical protein M758_UG044700 [Ceratodon purpureus]|nr:hypothetical protein M758_UG044700 [Ceratodon purpureus]